jgi:hypothetical protein
VVETTHKGVPVVLSGGDVPVGIDTSLVPDEELDVRVAGGSACAARWELAAAREINVRVRAGLTANVIPRSLTQREVSWRHALYFAQDKEIGFMRLSYHPGFQSKIVMSSSRGDVEAKTNGFFPASARNSLHFKIEFLDMGYTAFNPKPMTQTIKESSWPPYKVPVLEIDEPVEFYDIEQPDRLVMTLINQTMSLYDYTSLQVDNLSFSVDREGLLRSRWRITNQSDEVIIARWFALGNYRPVEGYRDQANRMLGPAGSGLESYELDLVARVDRSSLKQFVTMNAVSMGEPVLAGVKKMSFRFPEEL